MAITRRGKVVARMVPPAAAFDRERARRAAARIRALGEQATLDGSSIRDLIDEGRR